MKTSRLVTALASAALAGGAAAVTLDGSIAGDTYDTRALQTVQTGFGGGFNELAGAYVNVDGGNLNVAITGKAESFNKVFLFIDSVAGGENTITASTGSGGNNVASDGWADAFNGFTFDAGVAPDYLLLSRAGNFGGDKFDFNFSSVGSTSVDEETFDIFGGSQTGSNAAVGASGLGVAYDSSLTGGSVGGSEGDAAIDPQNVTSGFEFVIPLSAIGNPNLADIRMTAFLTNGNIDFAANQSLGGLPLTFGNLGGSIGTINLADFDGDQFFTVPEPATAALLGLGGLAMLRRRQSA
ncbi:MAG: PEP-CTERM sorting domain-containing protein [Planctomycetota bacterium]